MNIKEQLLEKINNRTAVVGVIGLGYVGLPLAVEKANAGFKTIGFDIQEEKVRLVNEGHNYIGDVVDSVLENLIKERKLSATSDYSFIKEVDFVAICVPTPLDEYQQPDVSYVKSSTTEISKHLRKGTIVVLESTTYPGTTEELLLPILEEGSGLKCGQDFYLAFSPERVDPGNLIYKTKNTPKVVGGVGKDSTEIAAAMYRAVLNNGIFEASSPRVAEMEKILENTYRNINIGLVNEMAIICHKMGINVWEVIEAAKTKPYGFQAFYPGPGLGGHCIPLDRIINQLFRFLSKNSPKWNLPQPAGITCIMSMKRLIQFFTGQNYLLRINNYYKIPCIYMRRKFRLVFSSQYCGYLRRKPTQSLAVGIHYIPFFFDFVWFCYI
jgi:UDP-N-acetyl-D-glucosamine dehydrogenase